METRIFTISLSRRSNERPTLPLEGQKVLQHLGTVGENLFYAVGRTVKRFLIDVADFHRRGFHLDPL